MEDEKNAMQDGIEMKILSPLTAGFFQKDSCGQKMEDYGDWKLLDGRELVKYEDAIRKVVDKENHPEIEDGKVCDLMDECFDGSSSIQEKVEHAIISVENVEGVLYGCTTLQLKEYLESWELREMCEYIIGQYSDGWGEGFEQRDIQVDDGILNVYFESEGNLRFQIRDAEEKKEQKKEKREKEPCR